MRFLVFFIFAHAIIAAKTITITPKQGSVFDNNSGNYKSYSLSSEFEDYLIFKEYKNKFFLSLDDSRYHNYHELRSFEALGMTKGTYVSNTPLNGYSKSISGSFMQEIVASQRVSLFGSYMTSDFLNNVYSTKLTYEKDLFEKRHMIAMFVLYSYIKQQARWVTGINGQIEIKSHMDSYTAGIKDTIVLTKYWLTDIDFSYRKRADRPDAYAGGLATSIFIIPIETALHLSVRAFEEKKKMPDNALYGRVRGQEASVIVSKNFNYILLAECGYRLYHEEVDLFTRPKIGILGSDTYLLKGLWDIAETYPEWVTKYNLSKLTFGTEFQYYKTNRDLSGFGIQFTLGVAL